MDEMAYSINGENYHYGTPTNPCALDRVPGGYSSGSVVAVAANLVDFSIGTDTGGSVRVPAAYCGIFGFRPSHGTVSEISVIPMAQSFDTVGWFARDPSTLTRVGRVLLPSPIEAPKEPTHIIIPENCFQLLGSPSDQLSQILTISIQNMYGGNMVKCQDIGDYVYNEVPSSMNIISKLPENERIKFSPYQHWELCPMQLGLSKDVSVLVLNGNSADVAKHCMHAAPAKRISITFRKMDVSNHPTWFKTPNPVFKAFRCFKTIQLQPRIIIKGTTATIKCRGEGINTTEQAPLQAGIEPSIRILHPL